MRLGILLLLAATLFTTRGAFAAQYNDDDEVGSASDSAGTQQTHVLRKSSRSRWVIEETDEPVSTVRPNALSFELLGRGLLYGLSYDRSLGEHFAAGLGYSTWGDPYANFSVVPVYANYYFLPDSHRPFLTAGLTYAHVKVDYHGVSSRDRLSIEGQQDESSVFFPEIGAGYEYRGWYGFLFRAAIYEFIAPTARLTYGGLSIGATF